MNNFDFSTKNNIINVNDFLLYKEIIKQLQFDRSIDYMLSNILHCKLYCFIFLYVMRRFLLTCIYIYIKFS